MAQEIISICDALSILVLLGDVIKLVFPWVRQKATMDEAHRPYKLWRHKLGTPTSEDQLLFTESDELFWLGFGKGRSGRYLRFQKDARIEVVEEREAGGWWAGRLAITAVRTLGLLQ